MISAALPAAEMMAASVYAKNKRPRRRQKKLTLKPAYQSQSHAREGGIFLMA